MSKEVTIVTKPIECPNGECIAMGSDGQIYHVNRDDKKGCEPCEAPVITKKALAVIVRTLPRMQEIEKIKAQYDKAKEYLERLETERGSLGGVRFVGDNGGEDDHEDVGIGVGCTFIKMDELPGLLRSLGIKS